MLRNLMLLILVSNLLHFGVACTSSSPSDEQPESEQAASESGDGEAAAEGDEVADEGGGDGEEVADSEGDSDSEEMTADLDEEGGEKAGGEKSDEEMADIGDDLDQDIAADEAPAEKPAEAPSDIAATDSQPTEPVEVAETPAPAPVEDVSSSSSSTPAGMVPVKKIKDAPWRAGGLLANAVYLARPGDTVASVSQKIYGADKSDDIYKINPNLHRGLKAGDKVYYNSPKRPSDDSKLLTFYDDQGIPASVYESKEGDNIRKVSKDLLGFEEAWKEVYATNDVESKSDLPAGVHLKYWTGHEKVEPPPPAQTVAEAPPPPPPAPMEMEPPPPPAPPPSNEGLPDDLIAGNTNSSEANKMGMGTVEPPPPPPPPPPKAPPMMKPKSDSTLAGLMEDPNNLMFIGGGALLVIGLLAILAVARKRRTRIDFGQTQV